MKTSSSVDVEHCWNCNSAMLQKIPASGDEGKYVLCLKCGRDQAGAARHVSTRESKKIRRAVNLPEYVPEYEL